MKRFVRRVSIAAVSVAIAGGAVLGAGGSASAASGPVEQTRSTAVGLQAGDDRDGYYVEGFARGHDGERDDGRDGYRGWYSHDARGDHSRGWSLDDERRDDHRGSHPKRHYRWDGHRLYVRYEGRWVDVTPLRNGAVDRWYLDQVLLAQR
ncbi:hypothetical protein [Streptomyces sp. NPDC001530]|uniref:hypothetical protein n=1 Tax=Streptomyces sp. NPDC001530 TaxID=3364582 RepID=UPI0036D01146